jgi:hypothetical protein
MESWDRSRVREEGSSGSSSFRSRLEKLGDSIISREDEEREGTI